MTTTNVEKLTDRKIYEAIIEAAGSEAPIAVDNEFVRAWAEKKIDQLDRKAEKAKETAASKKAEGDALTEVVKDALTTEFETIADITARISGEDVTVSKVSYRLSALAKDETSGVEKGEVVVTDEDGKKPRHLVAYRLTH